ncbi:hypothetical protein PVW47_19350 [Marinovum sp. SP66]|uniref:hypothetical protein n=1 Tax=Marinovum TaxID=367771 RepID=UPI00237C233D|nr:MULTISPECIES: hypothetical protein [unclassified Marinovum]MDD9741947.1 hypothetical protein [Marinovum sp. SP66]MDD9745037.1 hypothetical protein [Marinovum sp. PR37]
MNIVKLCAALTLGFAVSACDEGPRGYPADKTIDRGINAHSLKSLKWGVYVDPDGCDHWISDDGVEGYQVNRLDRYGKPVCSGVAPPTYTAGDFKGGSPIADPN